MQKEKCLSQEDIDFLFSENWLTSKQQSQFNIYEGVTITREKIETLCPDQAVLDFIFKEKEIKISNIQYRVHHGTTVFLETFNDIKDAILLKEKLIESTDFDNVWIEVSYNLT